MCPVVIETLVFRLSSLFLFVSEPKLSRSIPDPCVLEFTSVNDDGSFKGLSRMKPLIIANKLSALCWSMLRRVVPHGHEVCFSNRSHYGFNPEASTMLFCPFLKV